MADWKSEVLNNLVIIEDMVDYVMEKYDEKGKDILKNDKASLTGPHILDDLEKRIDNVEVVLNKPKKKKLKEKDDHRTVFKDDHMTVLKGKPGSRSKCVRVSKHSSSKEDKLRSNYKTLEADVGLPAM
ncbi:hypothetical protein Tco_0128932 [Tanacetum coccineum]